MCIIDTNLDDRIKEKIALTWEDSETNDDLILVSKRYVNGFLNKDRKIREENENNLGNGIKIFYYLNDTIFHLSNIVLNRWISTENNKILNLS